MMIWKSAWQFLKEFFTRYPAVLSGYVIYSYLFTCIVRLFLKVKHHAFDASDLYDIFSALPFMWLLALALVKIIETRTRLHESEQSRLMDRQELQLKETQLATMKEVVKGLEHYINNPLAIISLSTSRMKRLAQSNPDFLDCTRNIELGYKKIASALRGFSRAMSYETQQVDAVIGNMAVPPASPN